MGIIHEMETESISIELTLSDEGQRLAAKMFREHPSLCPQCSFTHPSDMFRRGVCQRCGYVLQESDYWPDEIRA